MGGGFTLYFPYLRSRSDGLFLDKIKDDKKDEFLRIGIVVLLSTKNVYNHSQRELYSEETFININSKKD